MATQYDENIENQAKFYSAKIDAITSEAVRLKLKCTLDMWKAKSYALLNASPRGASSYSVDGKSFTLSTYQTLKVECETLFDEIQSYVGEIGTGDRTSFVSFGGFL